MFRGSGSTGSSSQDGSGFCGFYPFHGYAHRLGDAPSTQATEEVEIKREQAKAAGGPRKLRANEARPAPLANPLSRTVTMYKIVEYDDGTTFCGEVHRKNGGAGEER